MKEDTEQVSVDDRVVTIRPIRSTDMDMEADFIRNLSMEAKHFRFFGGLKELSAQEVLRLCTVDGRNSMAFVASVGDGKREIEIGVSRYAPGERADSRELAITVADQWQRTELPQLLLERLIQAAKHHGIRELVATELADNWIMHDFAQKNGMIVKHDPHDGTQVVYCLNVLPYDTKESKQ